MNRLVAHVCYKANSDVCHTAAILDAAHGNVQQAAHNLVAVYKLAVHRAALHYDATARDVSTTLGTGTVVDQSEL